MNTNHFLFLPPDIIGCGADGQCWDSSDIQGFGEAEHGGIGWYSLTSRGASKVTTALPTLSKIASAFFQSTAVAAARGGGARGRSGCAVPKDTTTTAAASVSAAAAANATVATANAPPAPTKKPTPGGIGGCGGGPATVAANATAAKAKASPAPTNKTPGGVGGGSGGGPATPVSSWLDVVLQPRTGGGGGASAARRGGSGGGDGGGASAAQVVPTIIPTIIRFNINSQRVDVAYCPGNVKFTIKFEPGVPHRM